MDLVTLSLAKKASKEYTDAVIDGMAKSLIYKGAVDYYNDLPNNAQLGDCYTVRYKGSSGIEPFGAEYVWGKLVSSNEPTWIHLGEEIDATLYEEKSNKVTSIDENSTDMQYPSAKCVYDLVGNINSALDIINGEVIS